ncbi:MAG: aminopeptidase P family protein [Bacteroidaceae bacterium]|nr:aminopeptidase P family protein [Bacteroidaceae bacterium]
MYTPDFASEISIRKDKIVAALKAMNTDAILIGTNVNNYYIAGRVFSGYAYINSEGFMHYYVKRPALLKGDNVTYIRKPEDIPALLQQAGVAMPATLALEMNFMSYSDVTRLAKSFPEATPTNGSAIMSYVRSTKTAYEVEKIRTSAQGHMSVYKNLQGIYHPGMTDAELQIEIEMRLRRAGCLGIFRVAGPSMEVHMGSLISGDNADNPSPYDFAMGGAGLDSSLPGGCNGTVIEPGMSTMVDLCGNFTGYMSDISRTYSVGTMSELAQKAHNCSIAIHRAIEAMAHPGVKAADIYNLSRTMAEEAGLGEYFMGHNQQAGFVGHGVGIEINESPVLAPRSRDVLEAGNVIAVEPKFVIPGTGAVGIENTYLITTDGIENLTNFTEEIMPLD